MPFGLGGLQKLLFGPIVPIVRVQGIIGPGSTARIEASLRKIDVSRSAAVALVINSRGGSPTQSSIMLEKIQNFCEENHLRLYTFAEDIAASGGYYLLCAGDKVYVDNTSWVGSIGVVSQAVSIKNLLEKNNIEIRDFTTNEDSLLYNAKPTKEITDNYRERVKNIGKPIHDLFIKHVEEYRGKKITIPTEKRDEKLYQAEVWTGKHAVELGLADELGTFEEVLPKEFPRSKLVEVTHLSFVERIRENTRILFQSFAKGPQNNTLSANLESTFSSSEKTNL